MTEPTNQPSSSPSCCSLVSYDVQLHYLSFARTVDYAVVTGLAIDGAIVTVLAIDNAVVTVLDIDAAVTVLDIDDAVVAVLAIDDAFVGVVAIVDSAAAILPNPVPGATQFKRYNKTYQNKMDIPQL